MGVATVIVACKWPRGLIMRTGSMQDARIPVPGGSYATEKRWVPDGQQIHIKGPGRGMRSDDPDSANTDGFALTFNVPKEAAENWFSDNKDSYLVKNGLVRMHTVRNELKAMTREYAAQKTGIEPLDPNGDPRTPKRTSMSVEREIDEDGRPRTPKAA